MTERHRRWKEKLYADPVRLAAYREKTRKAALAWYAETRKDPAKMAERRKANSARARGAYVHVPRKPGLKGEEAAIRRREWQAEYRSKNASRVNAYARAWRKANPELVRAEYERSYEARQRRKAEYYRQNPQKVIERVMRWRTANRDKVLNYSVRRNLASSLECSLREVPEELIQLMRAHLNLQNELRTK